ncbi:NUDIX domain-containing protein [Alicyclobacillus fastidiosus]|uniref:NUDIX domain-containing protein n=1 Tax=Alicyclobacillus fastidiosus TaxID=392011 RepID=A0ABY6ZEM2_9BACL|nr:NUDIX domain-containing protein [Alicyclobacillus fastidiosus]WAH41340.1 NUDIX domain-containing protein [Alicyclobacillus fastidiosus]GMA62949.1 DNA mismatch repair protein MutT [Alicyclobacillus fastidiosus]
MAFPTHIVAVGGIVEDGHGNILLVKTRDGGWVFPGGQVEVGENLIDALSREIKEESGINTTVSHLIGIYSNTAIHKWYDGVTDVPTKLMLDFVCKPVGGELSVSDETTDSRWVARDQVLDLITAPAIRTRFRAYLDFDGTTTYMEYVTKPEFQIKNRTGVSR